jgi:hypothetical protein
MSIRFRFPEKYSRRLLLIGMLVALAFHVIRTFDKTRDEFEGTLIPVTERLRESTPSPLWTAELPYTITPYGPTYFFASRAMATVTPTTALMAPGRLVSVLASALTAVMISLAVRRRTSSVEIGLACGMVYLLFPGLAFWLHDYRVDSLAVMFAVASIVAPELLKGGLWVSVITIALGSTVKQPVALIAVPLFLHLLILRRWREAILFALGVSLAGAAIWLGLCTWSGGFFFDLAVRGNKRHYFPIQAMNLCREFVLNPLVIISVVGVLAAWFSRPKEVVVDRYVIVGIFSLLVGGILSGADGASSNSFIEPAAVTSILLGAYGLNFLRRTDRARMSFLLFIAGFVGAAGMGFLSVKSYRFRGIPIDVSSVAAKASSPYILADWQYIAPTIAAGLKPAVNDPFFYGIAVLNGAIDPEKIRDDMRSGRISALLLSRTVEDHNKLQDKWPRMILEAMLTYYTAAGRADSAYLYLAKPTK